MTTGITTVSTKKNTLKTYEDFITFITDVGSTPTAIRIKELYTIPSGVSVTIPSNIDLSYIAPGAGFYMADGTATITIGKMSFSPSYKVFHNMTSTSLVFLNGAISSVSPRWFGAVGDGVTNDSPSFVLARAVAAASELHLVLNKGTYLLGSDPDLSSVKTKLKPGAVLSWTGFNPEISPIIGDTQQHFDCDIADVPTIPKIEVTPQMFGAVCDGTTNDLDAFLKAGAASKSVHIPAGEYGIDGVLQINEGAYKWHGSGIENTKINLLSAGSKVKVGTTTNTGDDATYDISMAYFWISGGGIAEIGFEISGDYSPYSVLGHFHDFRVTGCTVAGHNNVGTQGAMIDNFNIRNNTGDGILMADNGTVAITTATVYKRGRVYQNDRGAYINKAWGIGFEGVNFESNAREGVLIEKQDGGITCDVISFTNKCWFEGNLTGGNLNSANLRITKAGTSYCTYITIDDCTFNRVINPESSSIPTGNVHIDYYADNVILGQNYYVVPSRVPIRNSGGPNQKALAIGHDQSMFSTNYRTYNATITGTLTNEKFAKGLTSGATGRIKAKSATTVSIQRLSDFFTVGETVEEWDTEAAKGTATATFVVDSVKRYSEFSSATTLLNGNGYSSLKGGLDVDGNCYIDGTVDATDSMKVYTSSDDQALEVFRANVSDGAAISTFAGGSLGLVAEISYFACGADADRVGLRIFKQGTAIWNIWVGDDGNLHADTTLPTSGNAGYALNNGKYPNEIPEYTVAALPAAADYPSCIVIVSNESGGRTIATSDGTNWRRVSDGAIVS